MSGFGTSAGTTGNIFGTPNTSGTAGGTKPPGPGLFGTTNANPATPKPASNIFRHQHQLQRQRHLRHQVPFGSFLSSKPAESSAAAKPADQAAPKQSCAFGSGGNLFGKPAAAAPSTNSTPTSNTLGAMTTAAPAAGFLGNQAEKKDGTAAASPSPAPAAASSLFGPPKTDTGPSALVKTPSDKPAGAFGALGSTSTAPTVAVQPPSVLRGKTIEEIVNKWSSDLETHVTEFDKFAGEVAAWDRALIENGNNLAALYSHVLAAEREQNEVDQSLDHIEQQQKDLATTLDAYEKVTQEIFGGQNGGLRALDSGPADAERDKNAADEPMSQIAQILSSHLESLQWIDGAVRDVEGKVSEVEKRVDSSAMGGGQRRGFGLR
ncbi:Nsp1-like C-terminal region-domain-containing protein [Mycena floridula]|nr:Nsp1-like C-terminal region-domain-containing protein [Mycena floridula]